MKDYSNLIKDVSDWTCITGVPSYNTRLYNEEKEKYGTNGVYLIATLDNLPKDAVDPSIKYIGKSSDILTRLANIRAPRGSHNCKTYINNKKIDISTVYYKILYTVPGDEGRLEQILHSQMEAKHGYRFAWKEASAGADGSLIRIFDAIDNIEDVEELRTISLYIDEAAKRLFLETWKNGD